MSEVVALNIIESLVAILIYAVVAIIAYPLSAKRFVLLIAVIVCLLMWGLR